MNIIHLFQAFRRAKPSATLHDIRTARAQAIAKAKRGGPGAQVAEHEARVLTTAQLRLEGQRG